METAPIQSAINRSYNRGYEAGTFDANDDPVQGDFKSQGYKRVTSNALRDFSKMSQSQILETVWSLWQSSPLARRLMVLKRDHIVGRSLPTPAAGADDIKHNEVLDEFWQDNKLRTRASEFTLQLFTLGEQVYPAYVRESDGKVTLGYIDPAQIEGPGKHAAGIVKHPYNNMEDWIVITRQDEGFYYWRIIRQDTDYVDHNGQVVKPRHPGRLVTHEQANIAPWEIAFLNSLGAAGYTGSVFYTAVNRFSNQSRGKSDLTQLADWIDQVDNAQWAIGERETLKDFFSFDVTLEGADDTAVRKRAKEIHKQPPERGQANVHNDAEKWEVFSPSLGQHESVAGIKQLITNIMGGAGLPAGWYAEGGDVNRSTLQEQATPTEKTLEHDQGIVKDMLLQLCKFAIDQAIIAGTLATDPENSITLDMPAIRSDNLAAAYSGFAQLLQAILAAEEAGYITKATAARIWHKALNEIDIEINTEEELTAVDGAEDEQEESEAQQNNEALTLLFKHDGK